MNTWFHPGVKTPLQWHKVLCKKNSNLWKVHPVKHHASGPLGPKDFQYYSSQLYFHVLVLNTNYCESFKA